MAELGDLLTGGSQPKKEATIEMLDYDYLDKCTDPDLIRAIIRKLRSGDEGHYPHLVQHAEKRLLEELPPGERSRILRMKAEPQPDEIYQATSDLHDWETEIAMLSATIKGDCEQKKLAPCWTSCAEAETRGQTPKVVEIATHPSDEDSRDDAKPATSSVQVTAERQTTKRLNAYDFRSWEKYSAEEEIKRLEREEEEEERRKNAVISSAKTRAEQEARRRAEKREQQMQEARKGRFKESLSLFERKRAADRERVKGNESFKAKEFEEAFRCYTCSLALDDENARVHNNRAAAAHKLERFEHAEDDCTRAIAFDPSFKKAWMRRGMVRHSRGKYAGAVADFTKVLDLDPTDKYAKKLRAHSAAKQREVEGDTTRKKRGDGHRMGGRVIFEEIEDVEHPQDGAEEEYVSLSTAKTEAPPPMIGSKETTIAHGWIEEMHNGPQESRTSTLPTQAAFSSSTHRNPTPDNNDDDNVTVMQQRRRVDVVESDSEDEDDSMVMQASRDMGVDPADPGCVGDLVKLGEDAYLNQEWERAMKCFEAAFRMGNRVHSTREDKLAAIGNNIAACLLQAGNYERVVARTENVGQPPDLKMLLRRWFALSKLGDDKAAAETLAALEGIGLDGDVQGEVDALKHIFAAEAEKAEALARCDELRKEGNELMKENQKANAIAKYTEALGFNPCDVPASNNRAQANLDLERFEEAEHDASVALKHDPDNLKARYRRARARAHKRERDTPGACADLAKIVAADPKQKEAILFLYELVKSMELSESTAGSRKAKASATCNHVSFMDGTEPGDDVPVDEEKLAHDKEVEPLHPENAKTHWPVEQHRRLMIVEEDDEADGCSWCPVVDESDRDEGKKVAQEYLDEGERLQQDEDWDNALDAYTRGAVADPSSARCWLGLARVHRQLENYQESVEAASRAHKIDQSRASFLSLILTTYHANAGIQSEKERFDDLQEGFARLEEFEAKHPDQTRKQDNEEIFALLQSKVEHGTTPH